MRVERGCKCSMQSTPRHKSSRSATSSAATVWRKTAVLHLHKTFDRFNRKIYKSGWGGGWVYFGVEVDVVCGRRSVRHRGRRERVQRSTCWRSCSCPSPGWRPWTTPTRPELKRQGVVIGRNERSLVKRSIFVSYYALVQTFLPTNLICCFDSRQRSIHVDYDEQ